MIKKLLQLTIASLFYFNQGFAQNSENISVTHESIGGLCFTTIDIITTEEWLEKEEDLVDLSHYPNIRSQGFIMDMFYSNAGYGKALWTEMDTRGIYVNPPGSIYLPVATWAESGMGSNWYLRITMLNPASGNSCK